MWNKNYALFGIILVAGLGQINAQQNAGTPPANISCYSCEDASCTIADVTALPLTQCGYAGAECVTVFNMGGTNPTVSARGCSNLLSAKSNATCIAALNNYCFQCESAGCNIATQLDQFIDCYQCDSYSNSECVWNTTSPTIQTTKCFENCMVALVQKSAEDTATFETYRGCATDADNFGITTCNSANNCWSCNDTNCNTFNEPTNRLTCNFCSNSVCNATFQQDCLSYRTDDKCAYVLNNDSSISYLACASNFDTTTIPYMVALGILVECDGANCNTLANMPHPNITGESCVSCSSENNELCATDPSKVDTLMECTDLNKMCISEIIDGGYTIRGCLADQSQANFMECYSGSNETYCFSCTGANCNNQVFPASRLSCYRCSSTTDSNCEASPTNSSVCPIYSANESCIQYLEGNVTVRGCGNELSCQEGQVDCKTCTTSGCNNQKLTSGGASTIQVTGTLLAAGLLAVAYRVLGL